jgi:predicted HTH domain antitoxin
MTLSIELPADIESTLRSQLGPGLEERAKEDLAVSWFREGRLTSRQVATFLGMSLFEAHAFLKRRNAALPMSISDVEADLTDLRGARDT